MTCRVSALLFSAWVIGCTAHTPTAPENPPAAPSPAAVDTSAKVRPPLPEDDPYARLIRRAEDGDESVDFTALRVAFLKSPALSHYHQSKPALDALHRVMAEAIGRRDHVVALEGAQMALGLVYVDLEAHKARRQLCAALKDEECARRAKYIELGLLKSVLSTGDGASCATAWNVVTIDEEYFVLRIREMTLREQSLVNPDGLLCDEMKVTDALGKPRTYFFDIRAMMSADPRFHPPAAP